MYVIIYDRFVLMYCGPFQSDGLGGHCEVNDSSRTDPEVTTGRPYEGTVPIQPVFKPHQTSYQRRTTANQQVSFRLQKTEIVIIL